MPRVRSLLVCALMSVSACAGRYHSEVVGQGTAIVQPRTEFAASMSNPVAPWAVGKGVTLPQGSYDLALLFDLPRAQIVDWTVTCPGVEVSGRAGEDFEQYRARRIAELRAQRDRDRQRVASVTSAIIGSVGPRMDGYAHVATPGGEVVVAGEARLPAGAIGSAVANHAVEDVIDLPPGDIGRGRLGHTVHVETKGDGVCAVTAAADDPNVLGSYQVTRIRDLDAEARVRVMARTSAAITVRGELQARLVAHGADPLVHQRRLAAEAAARARIEAQARLRVEAELEVEARAEAHLRSVAMEAREELRGRCRKNGADPERRTRIALQEQAAGRVETEAHVRLTLDVEQRRLDLALRARTDLRARLVALGATPRPPMPELLPEESGEPPFPGARWTPGRWVWMNGAWTWQAGYWSDPTHGGERGDGDVMIGVGAGLGVGTDMFRINDRDERVRDHRDERVRDHRDDKKDDTKDDRVRDHRREEPRSAPHVRDHRDDKKDDDKDDRVRDHRRR